MNLSQKRKQNSQSSEMDGERKLGGFALLPDKRWEAERAAGKLKTREADTHLHVRKCCCLYIQIPEA